MAGRNGLVLASGGGRTDPVGTDLGHARVEFTAGSQSHVVELRAGGLRRNLGMDLVPGGHHTSQLPGSRVGPGCVVHQPLGATDVIN